jgi:hypothetical protein
VRLPNFACIVQNWLQQSVFVALQIDVAHAARQLTWSISVTVFSPTSGNEYLKNEGGQPVRVIKNFRTVIRLFRILENCPSLGASPK